MIEAGGLDEEEAYAAADRVGAHALHRSARRLPSAARASEASTTLSSGDVLVLCCDGLWSYMASPEAMAAVVRRSGTGAAALARALVHEALVRGGHDNVSVAVYVAP